MHNNAPNSCPIKSAIMHSFIAMYAVTPTLNRVRTTVSRAATYKQYVQFVQQLHTYNTPYRLQCRHTTQRLLKPTQHTYNTQHIRNLTTATDSSVPKANVRNIAIIAHVDHGKTTLVDCLLRQSNTKLNASDTRVMDHNALERERGITILSKCTSIIYQAQNQQNYQINLVDTPGHADFGGEVERIMSMVDGVVLVVDATEGPMTQTKFVLSKALKRNIKPLVVVNKVDRPTARVGEVENEIFDLFVTLNATDEQMEYPVVYASARDGWATDNPDNVINKQAPTHMHALFTAMTDYVPAPNVDVTLPFSMLVTQIDSDQFLGKLLIGRVTTGKVNTGDILHAIDPEKQIIEKIKVTKILCRRGLEQIIVDQAEAGDVISIAGFSHATVNSTLADITVTEPLKSVPIDPPTLSMAFSVNDSPLAGQEGSKMTSGMIKERLRKEAETNVSLQITQNDNGESFEVRGRGELQLGILIETMRREGFELTISAPRVVFKPDPDNPSNILEPCEEVIIDTPEEYSGSIIEKLSKRKGELKSFEQLESGKSKLSFIVPMRGLIGYRSELTNETKGQAIMNTLFHSYVPFMGSFDRTEKGALIATQPGKVTGFALEGLQDRGILFVKPGDEVYQGQVVGENSKEGDLEINVAKNKALTNVRNTQKDEFVKLIPPRIMSLEETIAYVRDDEAIEVTTKSIRLRKKLLDATDRKKATQSKKQMLKHR